MPAAVLSIIVMLSALHAATAADEGGVRLHARQQQAKGTPLYLDEPSCDSYQCAIIWFPGDHVTAHWLDAPAGNVVLDLMTDASSTLAHNVATVPGTTSNCDNEGQSSCGQFSWVVPTEWQNGNYTLRLSSVSQPSTEPSYTDVILVKPANGTAAASSIPFSALDPTASGTSPASSTTATASSPSNATSTVASAAPPRTTPSSASGSQPTSASNAAVAPAAYIGTQVSFALLATAFAAFAIVM